MRDFIQDLNSFKMEKMPNPQIKERISSAFLVAIALLASGLLVGTNMAIVWVPFAFFSILFVVSLIRVVFVSVDDTTISMSSVSVIISGAAVVFYTLNAPFAFVLAIATTVVYPVNIRDRKWALLAFNVSNDLIAGCAVYGMLHLLNFSIDAALVVIILKVLVAASAYEIVNYSVLAIDSAFRGEAWRELLYDLRKSLVEVLPLAVFSGLLGKFYFDYGSMMLVMFAVPIFFGRELHASYARMHETQKSTLETLTRTLEAKDKYTAGHVERVAKFAKYIGEELGYSPKHLERIRQAALLHDAGKLIVPSALLNKPGKLTEEEFKVIQRHEFVTIEILSMIDFLAPIAFLAGGDHNSMDGKSTKNLDPFIVSACDAFDAMTSSRSYRKALSMEIAFEELNKKGGKQFHPKVVEALIKAIESRGEHYGDGYETDIVHEDAPEAGIGSAGIGDLENSEGKDEKPSEFKTEAEAKVGAKQELVSETHSIPSVKRSSIAADDETLSYSEDEILRQAQDDGVQAQNDLGKQS